jgi:hypothetical protein
VPFSDFAEKDEATESPFNLESTDLDDKANLLIKRLVVNSILAMEGDGNCKPLTKQQPGGNKRESDVPLIRTYQLGHTPNVDCRSAVRDYLGGKGHGPPTVQSLIAGHWKNQVHGPGRTGRKRIHIEPYWRGPEDAPVLPRVRVLK